MTDYTAEALFKKLLEEMKKQRLAEERVAKALEKLVHIGIEEHAVYMGNHADQEEKDDLYQYRTA